MNEQPEALRLADALKYRHGVNSFEGDAAAELRHQYVNNLRLRELLTEAKAEIHASKNYELLGRINAALQENKACTTTM